jgi:hypothetical protein
MASMAQAEITPVASDPITVPSGQSISFLDSLQDRPAGGLTARFRFVAPELSQNLKTQTYDQIEADLAYLCKSYALPRLGSPAPSMIVISLSERATEFGSAEPNVAQVFEAYRPVDTTCEWEAF